MKTSLPKGHKVEAKIESLGYDRMVRMLNTLMVAVFVLFVLIFSVGLNAEFLRKLQDLDLFAYSAVFFENTLERIGGLSVYVGSFLTQFFYVPWLGSLIYLSLLLLVTYLTAKAFDLKGRTFPLAFIPSLALLLTLTELGYMIYIQKIHGFAYIGILGVLLALSGLILFKKIRKVWVQVVYVAVFLLIAYPVSGVYGLLGGILMLLYAHKKWISSKERRILIPVLAALVFLISIPLLYYWLVFSQTTLSHLYLVNLPLFFCTGAERILWLPYVLMAVFFILASLWNKHPNSKLTVLDKGLPVTLFVTCLIIVAVFSYQDRNFNTELSMVAASEKGEWNDVLKLARKQQGEPTRLIVMNTNLALFKLGIAGDKIYHYKDGAKAMNSSRQLYDINVAGRFFYYQYGKLNYCYRWCMEDMVEYGMNVSVLKYFVKCSLMNGETDIAQKYNDILKSTLFYKSWAKNYQPYIDNQKKVSENPEFAAILPLTGYENLLDGDHFMMENFLRNSFAYMVGGPPAIVELSTLFCLEFKDINLFWPRFFYWAQTHQRIPVHFQEAALLYRHLENKVNLDQLPFDKEVVANFQLFLDYNNRYASYPEESIRSLYYNQFGKTFWFYYFFVKNHTTGIEPTDK
jgi:hypothetical protein